MSAPSLHPWTFFRAGGVDQVLLGTGADIAAIPGLDQKLWVALALPTRGVKLDPETLALLDVDHDGHVRPSEIIGAIQWLGEVVESLDEIVAGGDSIALSAIKDPSLKEGARRVLNNLDKGAQDRIALADVTNTAAMFVETKLNGDGVVPPETATDPAVRAAINDILATLGGTPDKSGKPGVDAARMEQFFTAAESIRTWAARARTDSALAPLGEDSAAAYDAWRAVAAKVDDFFGRCRVAAFDPRAAAALNRTEAELAALAGAELSADAATFAAFPIAHVAAGAELPLAEGHNPAWAAAIEALRLRVVEPILGKGRRALSAADWAAISARFAARHAWVKERPATALDALPAARIEELATSEVKARLAELIAADKKLAPEADQLTALVKLLRFKRDLLEILNNLVSFADFYRGAGAVFQAGTLYLDARSCSLCIEVTDAGRHAALAGLAGAFLAYCDCARGTEKKTIVAVFTNGDSDNLLVGRNGVFYDRKGQDWDATVTKVVTNPISLREAFWSPYKKLVRLIEEQVAKRAAEADSAANAKLADAATATANVDRLPKADKPAPKKLDIGVVAALGVAVGAIGTAISALATGLISLPVWQMPLVFVGIIALISGPSMIMAWFKLRNRNLGPILDASGWAINTHARINATFGATLTKLAALPKGSRRTLRDPFADKKRPWWLYLILLVIVVLGWNWYQGDLDDNLPTFMRSTSVLGDYAPAAKNEPAPTGEPAAAPAAK